MDVFHQAIGNLIGGKVLDVATGSGGFIHVLVGNLRGYDEIIGIDTSDKSAAIFQEAFQGKNIRFLQMDASRMDFPDQSFDTVCIANSLHHMADLTGVLAEMLRVLRPGGQFFVTEMYRDHQSLTQQTHVCLHHWWAAVDTAHGIPHYETYSRQRIVNIIQSLGLVAMHLYDHYDLSDDPKDPQAIQELDSIIDRFIQRTIGLPYQNKLQWRGEILRQRLHDIGIHGASALIVTGWKPSLGL